MSISPTFPLQVILPLAPVIGRTPTPQPEQFFQDRQSDLEQLGQSLHSGDLAGAQQEYSAIQTLAQNGPFDGSAFAGNPREQDFTAIGQALQSGDLSGAQQGFVELESTFTTHRNPTPQVSTDQPATDPGPAAILTLESSGSAASGATSIAASPPSSDTNADATRIASASVALPQIVLNLGSGSSSGSPEQINLSLNNTSKGDQINIGIGSQQNPNAQELIFNLAQNNNEQIVFNLLADSSATSPSSQTSSVDVVA